MTDAQLQEMSNRLAEPWYVVEAPWGDGTQVVAGNPDPHVGTFICDGGFVGGTEHPSPEANAAAVVQTRDDAFALLLEVQRLRRRDTDDAAAAANVVSSQKLEQIRWLATTFKPVAKDSYRQAMLDLLVHADAQASLIRTLYDLIADLKDDLAGKGVSAYERGLAEGRQELIENLEGQACVWEHGNSVRTVLMEIAVNCRSVHCCRVPVRPSEAETILRRCVNALNDYCECGEGQYPGPVFDAIDAARPLLGMQGGS